ncbi:MAG: tetraacyldisaccharide 4'-kinase [Haemophilus parainfluenzae]|jgi:UPF0434 protein dtpsy_1553|nr:MAG: tetraacyldisaccharide 4'-kinase [Haemophilus parainfluenzae]
MTDSQLAALVCPISKGKLIYDRDHQELISKQMRLAFPIRDGIPILLEEEARPISSQEYNDLP